MELREDCTLQEKVSMKLINGQQKLSKLKNKEKRFKNNEQSINSLWNKIKD